jgi:uncharacterized protein (DUF488 family)
MSLVNKGQKCFDNLRAISAKVNGFRILPPGNLMKTILTMGTGNRTLEEFILLLRSYSIEMVIDVRSFPKSKFPHFAGETLAQSLGEAGYGYSFLGKELGGYRTGGYEAYMQTYDFLRGMDLLERLAGRCRCAIICAERLPWQCHRRFIGRSLRERGWTVEHVIDEGRLWEQKHLATEITENIE